ncbi:hypothetical protein R3P38DRAFT_2758929 [Favolaschia claudopus]|uniref:Uncharacterized protein n=1 Tax=Favolaschia claudopus TaxID=2862362 RepID=A0AAW0E2R0_9AGAR
MYNSQQASGSRGQTTRGIIVRPWLGQLVSTRPSRGVQGRVKFARGMERMYPSSTPQPLINPSDLADSPAPSTDAALDSDSESFDEPVTVHPLPYIRCILVLVAYLHTKHHLSFLCSPSPGTQLCIHDHPGQTPRQSTDATHFGHCLLSVGIFPICYLCNRIFTETDGFFLCPTCKVDIYRTQSRRLFNRFFAVDVIGDNDDTGDADDFGFHSNKTAHLVQPIQLLSDALRDLLARPGPAGMVDAVNLEEATHCGGGIEIHSCVENHSRP